MSIKDEVAYVKRELSNDEMVLESALKLETLYNKHKLKIWAALALIVLIFAAKAIFGAWEASKLQSANEAFLILQKDPKNSEALERLSSKNPALFSLYQYAEALKDPKSADLGKLAGDKNPLIADLTKYTQAVLASKGSSSIYYKDMSLIEDAYLLLQEGKKQEALTKLQSIDAQSQVAPIANLFKHYTIKGEK